MTCLLHSAVAAWFLSDFGSSSNYPPSVATIRTERQETLVGEHPDPLVPEWSFASSTAATGARERMGVFLIFKLLLISAVLAPDTLDLMILVTWFTLLGCLRSLDHLAHSTNLHMTAMGQPPKKGVVRLLFWVLACDIVAAGSCVGLFHTAGYGMVLLLTCDCALVGADAMSHVLKYYQCVLEDSHDAFVRDLAERQLDLHRANEVGSGAGNVSIQEVEEVESSPTASTNHHPVNREGHSSGTAIRVPAQLRQELVLLDHQLESLESTHTRRVSVLDTSIFCLDMTCHVLTVAHFCHIWALHGIQFTLIDGVLALHLHSAISTALTKLARRINVQNIARNLEEIFPNATDDELKKASTDGDVCCICLGPMTKGGNVKKVDCGHIYHTHCLREVIERAQNLQSAKCPLCRSSLVNESIKCCPVATTPSRRDDNNDDSIREANPSFVPPVAPLQQPNPAADTEAAGDGVGNAVPDIPVEGERSLFRFSTEGILPAWLPVPAFSFEVVRRPPVAAQRAAAVQSQNQPTTPPAAPIPAQSTHGAAAPSSNQWEADSGVEAEHQAQAPRFEQQQEEEGEDQPSFLHRFLIFAGLIPMSLEEEARALSQLVDMFPQYDRGDLLRELRIRGSIEGVTEAILLDIFPGAPRGG
eukprot:CAMPEP_0201193794 /NCGR_PEP_ID=MMETSP0851-20130426/147721_1 /ASSEMBLY_ACC=CAM_ASM_000631 /TAXON_ID=183588 /ORGANISM="Pseudo-nitzschia fraudulenta, Strain WWA7" /LENGTH=644 /DNA_ID=CAMNT_0047480365 /DNA_START=67 /DNA_END=2001 /DNA_ORIENTATION=-